MKLTQIKSSLLALLLLAALMASFLPAQAAASLQETSPAETETETDTPVPTQATPPTATATTAPSPTATATTPATPPTDTPTVQPTLPASRPLVLLSSYSTDTDPLQPGSNLSLHINLVNNGQHNAVNIVLAFTPGDLIPRDTGGVISVDRLAPGEKKGIDQAMLAGDALPPGGVANLALEITYTDETDGTPYTGSFALVFHVASPTYVYSGPTRTPTPVTEQRPQLVIASYSADVDTLQPGTPFNLTLEVRNLGTTNAHNVILVLGGGVTADTGASGTPQPGGGGVSGASGEFTHFAPLGSSNIVYLGDLASGTATSSTQKLIVNTSTDPGAYSVKFSVVYSDEKGERYVDEQVITLLVYKLPVVEINFYRQPDTLFMGQPGQLPLQIVNLGRSSVILGSMKVSVEGAELSNDTTLVGPLDPGGYFPLDTTIIPSQSGPLDIKITVTYTDDFNQPQEITQTLNVVVQEAPPMEPGLGPDGSGLSDKPVELPETFLQKALRFFKGLIGLDSGKSQPSGPLTIPSETVPISPLQSAPPLKGG